MRDLQLVSMRIRINLKFRLSTFTLNGTPVYRETSSLPHAQHTHTHTTHNKHTAHTHAHIHCHTHTTDTPRHLHLYTHPSCLWIGSQREGPTPGSGRLGFDSLASQAANFGRISISGFCLFWLWKQTPKQHSGQWPCLSGTTTVASQTKTTAESSLRDQKATQMDGCCWDARWPES